MQRHLLNVGHKASIWIGVAGGFVFIGSLWEIMMKNDEIQVLEYPMIFCFTCFGVSVVLFKICKKFELKPEENTLGN